MEDFKNCTCDSGEESGTEDDTRTLYSAFGSSTVKNNNGLWQNKRLKPTAPHNAISVALHDSPPMTSHSLSHFDNGGNRIEKYLVQTHACCILLVMKLNCNVRYCQRTQRSRKF